MDAIINKAYQLFSKYSVESPLDICTDCCMSLENEALLARLPVKDIPKDLLIEYNDGASTAKTPIDEVKHFLPRYIELACQFDFPSHSSELTFSKLETFIPDEWTKEEQEFLNEFSHAFFKQALNHYRLPGNEEITSILIMFWKAHFQIENCLAHWLENRSISSTLHFKDLYLDGFKQNNPTKMSNGFGDDHLAQVLRNWSDQKEVHKVFKENIEEIIIKGNTMDEKELIQLNLLYEILVHS